ncbi:hypothetical protein EXW32_29955 (plasmid) [Bacillus mycoides]|uniref:N-acetyltransferase domain-containing protein n=1 Tax=Bacillus mycoides TaxID=1405 RepID=A0ABC9QVR3_BACMY|nr:hypothetical protein [Bacillus mycoides]EJR29910.1 hypothetical protein III_05679 [Bacillus mycoides]QWG70548.1 hypothetical protein EXW32_29955 [Bacillus mycoides]
MNASREIGLATSKDVVQLKNIKIPYQFKSTVQEEICGEYSNVFRWIICKEDGKVIGFHRSKIVAGWGILAGILITPESSDIWLANNLSRFAIEDLTLNTTEGILAWAESPDAHKVKLMKRYGFEIFPDYIYRLIFDKESLELFINKKIIAVTDLTWRSSNFNDYDQIIKLLNFKNSFVDSLPNKHSTDKTRWYVCIENERIIAAINWWLHSDTLEIHFTLSEESDFDITSGLYCLLLELKNKQIKYININLEKARKMTLIRLLNFKPKTYRHGYISYLLYKKNKCLHKKVANPCVNIM